MSELVVLCDEDGAAVGTAAKRDVHTRNTALHLAFSCYLFDPAGRVLLTRRAWGKASFPGVLTNSCCGHPTPGETLPDAVRRRVRQELGIDALDVTLLLPRFRYRAVAADGTVENELCPVYRARTDTTELSPDPAEVDSTAWVAWAQFGADPLSRWAREQLDALTELGPDPLDWPGGDAALLPAAARSVSAG